MLSLRDLWIVEMKCRARVDVKVSGEQEKVEISMSRCLMPIDQKQTGGAGGKGGVGSARLGIT